MIADAIYWLCVIASGCTTGMSLMLLFHTAMNAASKTRMPRHIIPIAVSYTFLAALVGVRVYLHEIKDPLLLGSIIVAYGLGLYGLWIVVENRRIAEAKGGPPSQ